MKAFNYDQSDKKKYLSKNLPVILIKLIVMQFLQNECCSMHLNCYVCVILCYLLYDRKHLMLSLGCVNGKVLPEVLFYTINTLKLYMS